MVEASPKTPIIAFESQTLSIPLFPPNTLLMRLSKSQSLPKPGQGSQKPTSDIQSPCQCPHVLVCDDDSFQTMYYKLLFEGIFSTADKDATTTEKFDLRLELFSSGECLLERYKKTKTCGCMSLFLVITDYNMGKGKLNGVQTVHLLRKSEYLGPILLRSSEEKSDLVDQHPKFDAMIETGYITRYVEKNDLKKTKAVILEMVKSKPC